MTDIDDEISPAAMHSSLNINWYDRDSIATHNAITHLCISSQDPLPENFEATFQINACDQLAYCMIGLNDKPGVVTGQSYLGENFGVLGFCFSNVSGFEKNWVWHNTQNKVGDIIKLVKNDKEIDIFTNDVNVQHLTIKNDYPELYLACGLYGNTSIEILQITAN